MPTQFLRLSRHGDCYYFRRRVPADLIAVIKRSAIVKSLHTSNRKTAVGHARIMAVQTDVLFARLRNMTINFDRRFASVLVVEVSKPDGTRVKLDGSVEELRAAAENGLFDKLDLSLPQAQKIGVEPSSGIVASQLTSSLETTVRLDGSLESVPASEEPIGFSEAYRMFMAEAGLKSSTKRTYKSRLALAEKYYGDKLGDRSVISIDQPSVYQYSQYVQRNVPSPQTAELYLTTFAGMLNWIRRRFQSEFIRITTEGFLSRDNAKPVADERSPFSLEDIQALFTNARQYRRSSPNKYWVTIATPFLGCRIEEFAQLDLASDLKYDTASKIWYFSLNENPDQDKVVRKSLKKLASWRVIPIHSSLVAHGFVDFLKSQQSKSRESKRPFERWWRPYRPEGGGQKWSHYISNWGGRELKKLADQKTSEGDTFDSANKAYFHSIRHFFKQTLDRAGVSREISEALAGRQFSGSDEERYRKLQKDFKELSEKGIEAGLGELEKLLRYA